MCPLHAGRGMAAGRNHFRSAPRAYFLPALSHFTQPSLPFLHLGAAAAPAGQAQQRSGSEEAHKRQAAGGRERPGQARGFIRRGVRSACAPRTSTTQRARVSSLILQAAI